jgi:hypothetical protein
METENPLFGLKFRNKTTGCRMTIIGSYYEDRNDHGYVYQWDDSRKEHWISTNALNVSFERDHS